MREISIGHVNFWSGYQEFGLHVIDQVLMENYDVVFSDNPNYLFYSVFGTRENYLHYDSIKIFVSHEIRPFRDKLYFKDCDWSFSHHLRNDPTHYRLPNFLSLFNFFNTLQQLNTDIDAQEVLNQKEEFCAFVYSNPNCGARNRFFKLLNKYKRVNAGGSLFNNMDNWRVPKDWEKERDWLSKHKFVITFENREYPGYTTEKIYKAFLADAIPIYWGNSFIEEDFNSDAFINVREFGTFQEVVSRVHEIDQDNNLYKEYISKPKFPDGKVPENWTKERLTKQIYRIFGD